MRIETLSEQRQILPAAELLLHLVLTAIAALELPWHSSDTYAIWRNHNELNAFQQCTEN